MENSIPEEIGRVIPSLKGLECWYVSCGGAAGSTFELALGHKVRRPVPLTNPAHSHEFRGFGGEVSIIVWCAWRLDCPEGPLTSWDDKQESVEKGLTMLIGSRIDSFDLVPPAWDLNVKFSNALYLRIFCDHVPGEPSFDGNWDLSTQNVVIAFGPGTKYTVEEQPSVKH